MGMHGVGMMGDVTFVPGCATRLGFRPNQPIFVDGLSGCTHPRYCPRMDVTSIDNDTGTTVLVQGDVDSDTAPALEAQLHAILRRRPQGVVLDASEVSFLSSAGLSVLIAAHKASPSFRLQRGNRMVDRLIALTGLEMLYGDVAPTDAASA